MTEETAVEAQEGAEAAPEGTEKSAETSTATEEQETTEQKEAREKAEAEAKEKARGEKKYTDSDMAKMRRKWERETRSERDARIAAETEARVLREVGGKKAETSTAKDDFVFNEPEPNPDDFETHADYTKALAKYAVREDRARAEHESKKVKGTEVSAEMQKIIDTANQRYREARETFSEDGKDLDEARDTVQKAFDDDQFPYMIELLTRSESGPDILMHLAENKEALEKLADLAPKALAREFKKLEEAAPWKAKKEAPPPPSALSGRASATVEDDKLSTEEWMKRENARLAKLRTGGK